MNNIRDITNKYAITPHRYTIKKNATIVNTDDGHFVFKKREKNNEMEQLYKYLRSRNFTSFPNLVGKDDNYDIYEYIEDVDTPREQKALDMMNLLATLHYKTTYYIDVDQSEYKTIYEDTIKEIEYIYNYYTDIIANIEKSIYMSPTEYLIARNISKIFSSIMFARKEIDRWYEAVENKHKRRIVTLHNNLDLEHIIHNDNIYLLSWDKAKKDMPIYDLLQFYERYALDFDFEELFNVYESKYKLQDDERLLLFVLMSIPKKIDYKKNEMENVSVVRKLLDYIYKTEMLITPYYMTESSAE